VDDVAEAMRGAFREAMPAYLAAVLEALEIDPAGHEERLTAAAAQVWDELAVFTRPFEQQDRSPMEVMRAVAVATIEDIAGPEVRFAGPASSIELGETAWQAHLAWGTAKAKAVAPSVRRGAGSRPRCAVFVSRSIRSSVEEAVEACGYEVVRVRRPAQLMESPSRPQLALVDLGREGAFEVIATASRAGSMPIAIGTAVTDMLAASAKAAGARRVGELERFLDDPCGVLPVVG